MVQESDVGKEKESVVEQSVSQNSSSDAAILVDTTHAGLKPADDSQESDGEETAQTSETADFTEDPLANAKVPSAKLDHDYVPIEAPFSGPEKDEGSELKPCPECAALLEPWQICCHCCAFLISDRAIPHAVASDSADAKALSEAFTDWMKQAVAAYKTEKYGEAQTCFLEALTRVKALEHAQKREVEIRKWLARCYERQDKRTEATEQYVLLGKLSQNNRDEFRRRARELSISTLDLLSKADSEAEFRPPEPNERKLVPLYCSLCHLMLVEAEVYGYRNGRTTSVRCFCGKDGTPLVYTDRRHFRALKNAPIMRNRRALLLQAAADVLPSGRTKKTAMLLAFLTGFAGGHRFYLGEMGSGLIYLLLSWTTLPFVISIFEGLNYWQMSRVTFNLQYNIEEVIARIPVDETPTMAHSDRFAMQPDSEVSNAPNDQSSTALGAEFGDEPMEQFSQ